MPDPATVPVPVPSVPGAPAVRVEIVQWPGDADRRHDLAARGTPRLLLVDDGTPPPALADDEDWIRTSADERDTWARLHALARRAARARPRPQLTGRELDHGGHHVTLSPADSRLFRLLLGRFGHVVPWPQVASALWPDGHGTARQATTRISRLRARLAPAGLTLHTSRGQGVILDHAP